MPTVTIHTLFYFDVSSPLVLLNFDDKELPPREHRGRMEEAEREMRRKARGRIRDGSHKTFIPRHQHTAITASPRRGCP